MESRRQRYRLLYQSMLTASIEPQGELP
jgi:hypothetical protein